MKTSHEIAWTLLSDFYAPWRAQQDKTTSLSFDHIHQITGLDEQTLTRMNEKRSLVNEIKRIKNGTEIAKEIIEEIEQGKPHYPVCSLSENHNAFLDLLVCCQDEKSKQPIFNPVLLDILQEVVRERHLQKRVQSILVIFVQEKNPQMTVRDLLRIPYNTFARLPNCAMITTAAIMMFLDYFRINQGKDGSR